MAGDARFVNNNLLANCGRQGNKHLAKHHIRTDRQGIVQMSGEEGSEGDYDNVDKKCREMTALRGGA